MCVSSSKVECILSYTSVSPKMDTFHSLCSTNGTENDTEQWAFCLVMIFIYAIILVFTAVVLSSVVAAKAVMPVYALCYIRSNLVCENAASLKPMLKFALFLLFGNGLCHVGQSIAAAGSHISKSVYVGDDWLLLRSVYGFTGFVPHSHTHLDFCLFQASSCPDEKVCVEGLWQVL